MSAKHVHVGLDESSGAQRALEWAVRQAKSAGAEILAAHILTYSQEFVRDLPPSGLASWRPRLHDELHGGRTAPLRASGLAFRDILTEDARVDGGLIRIADDEDVELVVARRPRGLRHRDTSAGSCDLQGFPRCAPPGRHGAGGLAHDRSAMISTADGAGCGATASMSVLVDGDRRTGESAGLGSDRVPLTSLRLDEVVATEGGPTGLDWAPTVRGGL